MIHQNFCFFTVSLEQVAGARHKAEQSVFIFKKKTRHTVVRAGAATLIKIMLSWKGQAGDCTSLQCATMPRIFRASTESRLEVGGGPMGTHRKECGRCAPFAAYPVAGDGTGASGCPPPGCRSGKRGWWCRRCSPPWSNHRGTCSPWSETFDTAQKTAKENIACRFLFFKNRIQIDTSC